MVPLRLRFIYRHCTVWIGFYNTKSQSQLCTVNRPFLAACTAIDGHLPRLSVVHTLRLHLRLRHISRMGWFYGNK